MKTLDAIYSQHQEAVGLELFGSATDLAKRFSDVRLFDGMRARLNSLFTSDKIMGRIDPKIDKQITNWLLEMGYPSLSGVSVYVPTYLKCKVADYLDVLEHNNAVLLNIVDDLIKPTITLVGMLLNDPELLKSSAGVPKEMIDAALLNVDIDALKKDISKCFDVKSPSDKMMFTRAYARIADFEDAAKRVSHMQDEIGRSGVIVVRDKTDELFNLAGMLAHAFKNNSEYSTLSKKISSQLGEHLYKCALWVELYGAQIQQVNIMAVSIKDSCEYIKTLTKS